MISIRAGLKFIGIRPNQQFVYSRDLGPFPPRSLHELVLACADPRMSEWTEHHRGVAENTDWSENCQGMVTDGTAWFVSCNANDQRAGLYRVEFGFGSAHGPVQAPAPIHTPVSPGGLLLALEGIPRPHIGALALRNDWLYVPVQNPDGVWRIRSDFTQSQWLPIDKPPEVVGNDGQRKAVGNLFPWCDIHQGLLYTSSFDQPNALYAYAIGDTTLMLQNDQTIRLKQPEPSPEQKAYDSTPKFFPLPIDLTLTDKVQSGCFVGHDKILLLCDVPGGQRLHCHSTLTGAFLGRVWRPATSDQSHSLLTQFGVTATHNELEGVWFHPLTIDGEPASVHVLELNNEELSADDVYLWHYRIPDGVSL